MCSPSRGEWVNVQSSRCACGRLPSYRYGLLALDLSTNPDYWAFVLFKRLVDTAVMAAASSQPSQLRAYAYCGRSPTPALTLTLLNLSNDTVLVSLTGTTAAPFGNLR